MMDGARWSHKLGHSIWEDRNGEIRLHWQACSHGHDQTGTVVIGAVYSALFGLRYEFKISYQK